ncbi:arginine--tRNA ligase [Plantactinospora endophytica]|uniref:Arginine--tRNA ligase n=1 Tax=Plantactinospora endophytica TaxID=673535 RepID=A0ABQ4DUB7_9ACTN|nr:arginine--tRNA ligase [Plantactinospora endophytica]GIG86053.1 arginine--tRNA ligase [Plantactinospora endophytica]
MNLESLLADRLASSFAAVAGGGPVDPVVRRSRRADFQAEAALSLARRLGRPPREIAVEVVERAALADLCSSVAVSGPGFVNLTVADELLGRLVSELAADPRLGVPVTPTPETVVVDYSAPNVAKEMHVGHLRSTIIGDATARLLDWLGHRVVRANHLGDWGTPFGMLIEHLIDLGESTAASNLSIGTGSKLPIGAGSELSVAAGSELPIGAGSELSIGDLDSFYKGARAKFDADEAFRQRSRQRVVALQGGDESTVRLWRRLVAESESYFLAVYDRLDVLLTRPDFVGESHYNGMLGPVTDELDRLGLLVDSGDAACVFPPGFPGRDGEPVPLIVRKRDGGYGYPATDLAALRHRTRELGATRLLYVVGLPQRQHFEMVYVVARQAGWLSPPARAEHVGFGLVLGPDGRKLASRAGDSVKLVELLDEAVDRAAALARQKNPRLDPAAVAEVAKAIGIGAVKYADLSADRTRDYVFDWDRMLALHGNTAPYLQYAHARIRSIFRKAGGPVPTGVPVSIGAPEERTLALELLDFGAVVGTVERTLEFHRLAGHLYAVAFSSFFEHCPVLRAEPAVRDSRLVLCDLTARVLRQGLHLLGITAPDRM